MRATWALWGFLAVGTGVIAACGGTTDVPATKASDSGASGAGGTATGTGGKGGGAGGVIGTGGKGQAGSGGGGASGATGSGGAPDDGGACPPPTAPGTTRICLTVSPEAITARPEAALDKRGILVVQIFGIPNPPSENAGPLALAEGILPKNAVLGGGDAGSGPEIGLDELKEMTIDKPFPATVYARAIFIDDRALLGGKSGPLGSGAWIGGLNLDDGIQEGEPLLPISLKVGGGNVVDLPLKALRRLTATVHRTATPVGDGQGPLGIVVMDGANPAGTSKDGGPATKPAVFGLGSKQCADVAAGDVTVSGFVVGSGPYWVTGILNDLGLQKEFPPGGLVSLDQVGNVFTIPNKLTYAPTDYAVTTRFDLNFVVPFGPDAGPVPPNSCADLAPKGDAGP